MLKAKANRNMGIIFRNTRAFKNVTTLRVLYFALVRSHLEYGNVIWGQHGKETQ